MISLVEVYKRVEKSVIWVCHMAQKGKQVNFMLYKVEKTFCFCDWFLFNIQCILKRNAKF